MSKIVIAALAAATLATPALARDEPPVFVEAGAISGSKPIMFDATRAYVLLRTDVPTPLYLIKVPTAEDQAAYDKLRGDALAEAREKHVKKLRRYEAALKTWSKMAANTRGPKPEQPIEPTETNFVFTPFGLMASTSMGPMFRFAKGDRGASTYLQQLTPGEYRIYGLLSAVPNGMAFGSCFCMGSVKFEAKAGEVTDLGVILARGVEPPKAPPGDSTMPIITAIPNFLGPAPEGMALDPRLAPYKVTRAVYRPVGKLPNYFGVTIGRIPEMPGVFRYDRDRIVDLTATN